MHRKYFSETFWKSLVHKDVLMENKAKPLVFVELWPVLHPHKKAAAGARVPNPLRISGKTKAQKLRKNPRDTGRVSLEHPAGQTGVYRLVSQGFPVIYNRKIERKGHFGRDTGRVYNRVSSRVFSEVLCDFSYVPFSAP